MKGMRGRTAAGTRTVGSAQRPHTAKSRKAYEEMAEAVAKMIAEKMAKTQAA